ncbi:hypothetical protein BDA96_06G242600 [Sorghum bicolor]|uniref:Uncharacterized protein n=2 Tax=Sorghum bicolor TaxID=4558 RepID=A0A921QTU0_SORBI|nr:uncharacterized protein LOC8074731 isoform X2 [Sorghum bicolor]EES11453.1 hypothetical protein SORBI_3006G221400 [Sorghum bicolor]KAG0527553.1 hypothetical protein BDA96_06G242600 [Sorghum bicolor]|eukprot:XP_002447125.1 uncharacterized protein LOC8074731 isoform X2 [Sorghum bicolor]
MDFSAPSFSLGFDWDDDDDPPAGSDRHEQPRGYEAPDPPSFSLGIDDDDVVEAPRIPAVDRQKGHERWSTAPDPPSFSLGFDDDVVEEPRIRAGGRRKEHARGYTAPDPPSFPLGFDDEDGDGDILAADQRCERARPPVAPGAPASTGAADDDDKEDGFVLAGGRRPVRVERHRLDRDPLPPPRLQTNRFAAPDPPSFSLGFDDEDGHGDILAADQRREQALPQAALGAPSSTGTGDDDDKDDDFVLAGGKRPVRVDRDTIDTDPLPPPASTNRFKRLRKGPAPAHPAPTPQVLHCEAPYSSLIINDDDDSLAGGQHHEQSKPQAAPRVPSSLSIEDEDGDFFLAGDQQPEPTLPEPEVTQLKRLRKGPAPPHLAPSPPPLKVPGQPTVVIDNAARAAVGSWEDEIEDWTTDEDRPVRDVPPSVGSCSTSSNSKFSLLNRGVLMTQSATKANRSKISQTPNTSASISLEESCTKKLLPKITVSPMRKIYLLDSDTDADDDHNQNKAKTQQQNTKPRGSSTVLKSGAMMNDNWATPALDEFCNEYFKSSKDAGFSQQKEGNTHYRVSQPKNSGHFQQQTSSSGAELYDGPPAMHYLFHPDPRVGNLFRNRLQHFVPIGAGSTRENGQNRAESLSSGRRQFSSSAAANDDWVTPGRISVPTDASKRRVRASGSHSGSGHWFTDDSGRKVYVSKNGQELTGRNAYRQYQKESGRGFGRYKKKGSSGTKRGAAKVKTETAAKRGTSRAKRKR